MLCPYENQASRKKQHETGRDDGSAAPANRRIGINARAGTAC